MFTLDDNADEVDELDVFNTKLFFDEMLNSGHIIAYTLNIENGNIVGYVTPTHPVEYVLTMFCYS